MILSWQCWLCAHYTLNLFPVSLFSSLFFSLVRGFSISNIRNENADSPPCNTARPIGKKNKSFGYSLLQNKHLSGGQSSADSFAHAKDLPCLWMLPADSRLRQAAGPPMSSKSKLSLRLCSLKSRSKSAVKAQIRARTSQDETFSRNIIKSKCPCPEGPVQTPAAASGTKAM